MTFSSRLPAALTPNPYSQLLAAKRAAGQPLIDLTISNPTDAGLSLHPEILLDSLQNPAISRYQPDPRGLPQSRQALADLHHTHPDRILLTSSTSESYSFLFKLLCNPGDNVLVPTPSYPLFEHLAHLDLVEVRTYPLRLQNRWNTDYEYLAAALTPLTRAIIVVNPNNPTGSYLTNDDLSRLSAICAERNLALISDEVFFDYPLNPNTPRASCVNNDACLTFTLNGLSKSLALPQIKLGWLLTSGPQPLADQACERLEWIADTYLSVSAPAQNALPALLPHRLDVQQRILARTRANSSTLATLYPDSLLPTEAGWSAILRLPPGTDEEQHVLSLLDRGIIVQPGYFYDLPGSHIVLSLLSDFSVVRRSLDGGVA